MHSNPKSSVFESVKLTLNFGSKKRISQFFWYQINVGVEPFFIAQLNLLVTNKNNLFIVIILNSVLFC